MANINYKWLNFINLINDSGDEAGIYKTDSELQFGGSIKLSGFGAAVPLGAEVVGFELRFDRSAGTWLSGDANPFESITIGYRHDDENYADTDYDMPSSDNSHTPSFKRIEWGDSEINNSFGKRDDSTISPATPENLFYPSDLNAGVYVQLAIEQVFSFYKIKNVELKIHYIPKKEYGTLSNPLPSGFVDVTQDGPRVVVVGSFGMIYTSDDKGETWDKRNSPTGDDLFAVEYGNGQYVAVGNGGLSIASTDGITWAVDKNPSNQHLFGLHFSRDQFVVTGSQQEVMVGDSPANFIRKGSPA